MTKQIKLRLVLAGACVLTYFALRGVAQTAPPQVYRPVVGGPSGVLQFVYSKTPPEADIVIPVFRAEVSRVRNYGVRLKWNAKTKSYALPTDAKVNFVVHYNGLRVFEGIDYRIQSRKLSLLKITTPPAHVALDYDR